MNLRALSHVIAERRRAQGLTLKQLASQAGIGRSTLAALEAGRLAELGYAKIARLCTALGLVLEARPLALEAPLMPHRHLTDTAGRELTKAAIEDVIVRGTYPAWRELVRAMNRDTSGRITRRVREVAAAIGETDPKARAFATLLPSLVQEHRPAVTARE